MRSPAVVLFTSYPIAVPRSGGQLRARALVEHYEANGFAVTPIAVFPARAFPRVEHGARDLEFPLGDERAFDGGEVLAESDDVQSGSFLANDDALFEQLLKQLPSQVDVFHLEQPWLLPVLKRLRSRPSFAAARVVYGSQNVEAPLKASICRERGLAHAPVIEVVERLEREAALLADVTLAVSESDARTLEGLGAKSVVLAANGIHANRVDAKAIAHWREQLQHRRVALFVGSAHAPNAAGFVRAFGDSLGFVPPDSVIVVAGRVGTALRSHYLEQAAFPALNATRLHITGELDEAALSALKAMAFVYLLPIFEGGGSNLKTSEALLSGRPVIATSTSLRGFERYRTLPELTVVDERKAWLEALKHALQQPEVPSAPVDALRSRLLWEHTLATVAPAVRAILK